MTVIRGDAAYPSDQDNQGYRTGAKMARAEHASASIRSDSIRGLAQSIAKPAYRRLLTAEPALRRAVPVLVVAFLATICVGASVQVAEHRKQTISEILRQIEAGSDLLADRINGARASGIGFDPKTDSKTSQISSSVSELDRLSPAWLRLPGRQILLINPEGTVIAGLAYAAEKTGGESRTVSCTVADEPRAPRVSTGVAATV